MKEYKYCQSCAMPFKEISRGLEADQTESSKFCSLCYDQGEFIEPEITYEEMLQRGIEGINKQPISNFKKKLMIKFYPNMLKKTERWS